MKIITFPFAGGNKFFFSFLAQLLPPSVAWAGMEYPGRGLRTGDPVQTNMDMLVDDMFARVVSEIDTGGYILYGHSMGALIAWQVCQRIERYKLWPPVKLVVSGCIAPARRRSRGINNLPPAAFWEEVLKMGGVPDEVKAEQELVHYFVPIIQADFAALDTFRYNDTPLQVPIDVFYGENDVTNMDNITAWQKETTGKVTLYGLEGNHFFIHQHPETLCNHFVSIFNSHCQTNLSVSGS